MSFSLAEVHDDDPRARTVSAMVSDLGFCLIGYGRVEFLFGDLVWHGRQMPEYVATVKRDFPISLSGRLRDLRAMLELPGPYSPWADHLKLLMVRLEQLEEPRHLFVHGHTSFYYTPSGDAAMYFRTFVGPPKGGGTPAKRHLSMVRPKSLAQAKFAWTVFAATAQDIIRDIYLTLGFEDYT